MTLRRRLDLVLFVLLLAGFLALFLTPQSLSRRYREVNLLDSVRPERDAVAGRWALEESALVTPAIPWGRLQFPYVPPEEYDVKLTVLRSEGPDSLNLGLSTSRGQFMIVLDGETGSASWIDRIDPKSPGSGATRHAGKIFIAPDAPQELEISVRKTGVAVKVGSRTIIDWKGDLSTASVLDSWKVRHSGALFVGSFETRYRITRLSVVPVSGEGTTLR